MDQIRARARSMRLHFEAGGRFTDEDVLAAGVTLDEALTVFSGGHEEDAEHDGIFPVCCGTRCSVSGGIFGGRATCRTCGAEVRDMLSPLDSPILERGNAYVTVPGDKLIERLGKRHWLVTHEGNRAADTDPAPASAPATEAQEAP